MTAWHEGIPVTLTLTADHQSQLKSYLFPSDGLEAAAIALCTRRAGNYRHRLLVQEIFCIPHNLCDRAPDRVSWPTDIIVPWLEKAEAQGLSVVKFHSHPAGAAVFSATDDDGDRRFLPAVRGWIEHDIPHVSVVMNNEDDMTGRLFSSSSGQFTPLSTITVVGHDLQFWHPSDPEAACPDFTASHQQAFGSGTTHKLSKLWAAVIGCSGTGSPIIEQLARLGINTLVLVDDDCVEDRNLNRILNTTAEDAAIKRSKADVLADAVNKMRLGCTVIPISKSLWDPEVIKLVAQCDIALGCMDTVDGRYLLNTLSNCYLLPYFDIGVLLDAIPDGEEKGRIREVCGSIHYLQPGQSSLLSRGLITLEGVAAAGLYRRDPEAYKQQLSDGYIRGIKEQSPAVISVNMFFASLAINDLLARIHPYREIENSEIAYIEGSLCSYEFFAEPESSPCQVMSSIVGKGDISPLLNMPELSDDKNEDDSE